MVAFSCFSELIVAIKFGEWGRGSSNAKLRRDVRLNSSLDEIARVVVV